MYLEYELIFNLKTKNSNAISWIRIQRYYIFLQM